MNYSAIEMVIPRVIEAVGHLPGDGKVALFPGNPSPMIDELVPCHPHQPGHVQFRQASLSAGRDGSQERLGREILSDHRTAAAWQEVAIDLGQRSWVDRYDRIRFEGLFSGAHTTSSLVVTHFRTWP